jgi:hypothetical protein
MKLRRRDADRNGIPFQVSMRLTFLAIALFATGCAAPAPVAPEPGPFRFSGTVSGMSSGQPARPIPGAELTVVSGVNANARVSSDAAGHYDFSALDSGRFTMAISAPGFVSATPVVDLYRDTEVNFALTPR